MELKTFAVETPEAMERLGASLARGLREGDRVLLRGVLGAGKTTLVRGIARGLGFKGRVTSPTFTLMNVYPGRLPVYHLDFYRLEGGSLYDEGLEDTYYGDGITLVEWPPPGSSRPGDIRVDIEVVDGDYELPRRVVVEVEFTRREILERLTRIADIEY